MISDIAKYLLELFKAIFSALWDFLTDIFVSLVTLLLTALQTLLSTLVPPDFVQGGLQNILNAIPGSVWFFAGHFQLGPALALIGSAFTFRLARKAVTLFQW
ncbi:MAG: DUF2523 domain-containing protein [Bacteroidota bacterium]